jgi:hypothetical protein
VSTGDGIGAVVLGIEKRSAVSGAVCAFANAFDHEVGVSSSRKKIDITRDVVLVD